MTILLPLPAAHPLLAAHRHFADMGLGEWAMTLLAVLVSAWAIWRSVGYALRPGETEPDHIKRSILDDERAPLPRTSATLASPPAPPAPRAPPPAASPPFAAPPPAASSSPAASVSAPR